MALFIGRLHDSVVKLDLENAFGKFGPTIRCEVKKVMLR
jgi:hypothetical protein